MTNVRDFFAVAVGSQPTRRALLAACSFMVASAAEAREFAVYDGAGLRSAASQTQPGDIVTLHNGTYTNSCGDCSVVDITRSGSPTAWIKYRAAPGHSPRLKFNGWHGIFLRGGVSYIDISGLTIEGNINEVTLDYCKTQQKINNPLCNGNGISVDGRKDGSRKPHHIRIANNTVHHCSGAGVAAIQADYITVEDNTIHDNSWYTRHATSGISIYQPWRFDESTGYKIFVSRNRLWNNKTLVIWDAIGKLSDGNGIIIDDTKNTQNGSTLGPYKGRTLVANNVTFNNGGSGIHSYVSEHVDIFNNTAYMNGQVVGYEEIFANSSNDVRIFNNIMYARPDGRVNGNYNNTNVSYNHNIYFNGLAPAVKGANDRVANPLFVNATTNASLANFRLQSGSPAIDSGTSMSAFNLDNERKARVQGSAIDRGAYERASTSSPANLVVNGGLESGDSAPWVEWAEMKVVSGAQRTGSFALQAGAAGTNGGGAQSIQASPNTTYTLRGWGRVVSGQWGAVGYALYNSSGTKIGGDIYTPAFSSTYGERTITLKTTADTARIDVILWTTGGVMYVDDVSLSK